MKIPQKKSSHKGLAYALVIVPILVLVISAPVVSTMGLEESLGEVFPVIYIGICLLLPFAGAFLLVMDLKREQDNRIELVKQGRAAKALIKSIRMGSAKQTSGGVDERWQAVLSVEVQPDAGEPFPAEFTHFVPVFEIPRFQPGALIDVKYDPADRTNVTLDVTSTG